MWYTMDSIDDFPLCWYGVPYRPRNFLEYAKELGIAGKPHLGVYCMPIVFRNIQLVFEADTGIRMRIEQVWGRPDYLVLAFYSNREVAKITLEKALEIEELLNDLDYPEHTKLRWWPDYYETVSVSWTLLPPWLDTEDVLYKALMQGESVHLPVPIEDERLFYTFVMFRQILYGWSCWLLDPFNPINTLL